MTPDPILERLDAIFKTHIVWGGVTDVRAFATVLRELLADVAIEHYNRGHAGDLGRWAESCAATRERFGVPAADKDAALDDQRCAVCGWTLTVSRAVGCVRGNCSMRPRPARLYDPVRAEMEEMSAGGQYGEGYRAALAAAKAEIEAMPYSLRHQPILMAEILARIARLEKEQGK